MAKISLKTLIGCLTVNNNCTLKSYVVKDLANYLSAGAIRSITEILSTCSYKEEEIMQLYHYSILTEKQLLEIISAISAVQKTGKLTDAMIMELYHSEIPFYIEISKEFMYAYYIDYIRYIGCTIYCYSYSKHINELISCGAVGMLNAMKSFVPSRGAFTTHSKPYIIHEMTLHIVFLTHHTSGHYYYLNKKIKKSSLKLEAAGIEPSFENIARDLNQKVSTVKRILTLSMISPISMSEIMIDALNTPNTDDLPDEICIKKEKMDKLHSYLKMLPEDILTIIYLRYFLNQTYKEIAESCNISINMAHTKERHGLRMLRKCFMLNSQR